MTKAVSFLNDQSVLLTGLALGEVGVWRWRIGSDDLEWSDNLPAIRDLPEAAFDGTLASFNDDVHPDDSEALLKVMGRAIKHGTSYEAVYRTKPRPNGKTVYLESRGAVSEEADGTRYLTGICMNVTERVESETRLKRQFAQQQAVARFGRFALEDNDLQAVMDEAVTIARDELDVPLTKILQFSDSAEDLVLRAGCGWREGLVGKGRVGIERESQAGFTLLQKEPVIVTDLRTETRFDGPQLLWDHGVVGGMSVTIAGTGERPFGVFGVHTQERRTFETFDVEFLQALANIVANRGRQHAAEEQRSLVLREMAHRAGNMLQLVSAIASQTFVDQRPLSQARNIFGERLSSLSRANHLISRGGWSATRFGALVEETLKPFHGRFKLTGRDVLLPPELSFDLGLVLHELATNSVKYGTLGADEGKVELAWQVKPEPSTERFVFDWKDPTPPAGRGEQPHSGFGNRMFCALIERKWAGTIRIDNAAGYAFSCAIPLAIPSSA